MKAKRMFRIVRFYTLNRRPRTIKIRLTLAEAREHLENFRAHRRPYGVDFESCFYMRGFEGTPVD